MSKNKYFLLFPPGEWDIQVPKGTLENPAGIDPFHDKVAFTDTSGMGCVEIEEDMAIMIAHHLPPRACIRTGSRTGPIMTVKVEPPEPAADDPDGPEGVDEPIEPPKPATYLSSKADIAAEIERLDGTTATEEATKPELWAKLKDLRKAQETDEAG